MVQLQRRHRRNLKTFGTNCCVWNEDAVILTSIPRALGQTIIDHITNQIAPGIEGSFLLPSPSSVYDSPWLQFDECSRFGFLDSTQLASAVKNRNWKTFW
ncbi:hypothetical protein L9F63_004780 [Diploptera punctata]|uniref:Uncharacterized protein n=1 Tax=Diploptera punctata TaxID=6984 RepID=A0AAD8E6Y4_DIPPU|nr:hypothetical protein L9F63_004780 [Diploptera punctata]